MKSSRIRFYSPQSAVADSLRVPSSRCSGSTEDEGPLDLSAMPCPATIRAVSPEQVVSDILISTLLKVQQTASAEVAAAASRYLAALR